MEYASKGVGTAGLSTGIIGTAGVGLGLLNGLLGGLGSAGGCHENHPVNRYEVGLLQELAAKDSQIALRDANTYVDQKLMQGDVFFMPAQTWDNRRAARGRVWEKGGAFMELQARMGRMTGDVQKDIKTMYNYVFRLKEELRYLMTNLDVTNFNDLGLARYENGRLQVYTEKLDIKAKALEASFQKETGELQTALKAKIDGISVTVLAQGEGLADLGKELEGLEQDFGGEVERLETKISTTAGNITAEVAAQIDALDKELGDLDTELSSKIEVNVNDIELMSERVSALGETQAGLQTKVGKNEASISAIVKNIGADGTVTAASIVAQINAQGESEVKIAASRVELSGLVKVNDLAGEGTTQINGSNIVSGRITGTEFVSKGMLGWPGSDPLDVYTVEISEGALWFEEKTGARIFGTSGDVVIELESGNYFRFTDGAIMYNGKDIVAA